MRQTDEEANGNKKVFTIWLGRENGSNTANHAEAQDARIREVGEKGTEACGDYRGAKGDDEHDEDKKRQYEPVAWRSRARDAVRENVGGRIGRDARPVAEMPRMFVGSF